jgi:hypothetical protein
MAHMLPGALTTEILRKKFKNNFDLCNFGINIGRNAVLSHSHSSLAEILQEIGIRADEQNLTGNR